ncbi:MAG: VOC family protein [Rhodobacteraceae bacterium]|nr:VOC family protein [Paracoccaceae bacterium]
MTFIPYLYFDGDCDAAMTFYAGVFGADDVQKMRYSDAPEDESLPDSDRIMYSQIMLGDQALMASDRMPGVAGGPQTSVAVNHPVSSVEAGQKTFDQLAEGGTITMPYGATFFSPAFGMVCDRFGTNWMIGVPPRQDDG